MRKLLNSWISGPLKVRCRGQLVNEISDCLLSFKEFIVVEFHRKPRTIADLATWKATELRSFLIYFGPIVLKNIQVDIAIYEHFLLLYSMVSLYFLQTVTFPRLVAIWELNY